MLGFVDPAIVGLLGLGLLLLLIGLRFPISLALIIVSVAGLLELVGTQSTISLVGSIPYDFSASWELSAIPMFLLMGAVAFHTGMTADLYRVARIWLGWLPGGLAVASNFACAGFAAASGSSLATTFAMGRIAFPEMQRAGYDKGLSTGVVATAGTLGSLIPPSVLMIVYGIFTGQSVTNLFLAGIVPGLLSAALYAAMIIARCTINPALAPPVETRTTMAEKLSALAQIWPLPVLIIGVIGSLYGGIATPTEAGALGALLAVIIGLVQRKMSWPVVRDSLGEALRTTAAIFFVSIGAVLLTRFMVFSGLPVFLSEIVQGWSMNLLTMLLATTLLFLLLGTFLEPIGLMLITLPVLIPVFEIYDINLIWFGILLVKYVEIGLITPPVGLNVFAMKIVVGDAVPIETIFRGVLWFLLCELVVVALLIAFPQIALFVPGITWTANLF